MKEIIVNININKNYQIRKKLELKKKIKKKQILEKKTFIVEDIGERKTKICFKSSGKNSFSQSLNGTIVNQQNMLHMFL